MAKFDQTFVVNNTDLKTDRVIIAFILVVSLGVFIASSGFDVSNDR